MTKAEDELDKYGKRLLAPLRQAHDMDRPTAARERAKYMSQAEQLRQGVSVESNFARQQPARGISGIFQRRLSPSLVKVFAVSLIVLVILFGSSFTVYAAQGSLPGDPLYTVKSWSEDVRLTMTSSSESKLNLILNYTNRRAGEISKLAASGKTVPIQTSERYQDELDSALVLAADMGDSQMQYALGQIKHQAEKQGMSLEELITTLPPQAEPAIIHLQERLQEQVNLSTFGEKDPQAFRMEVRERQRGRHGASNKTPQSDNPMATPTEKSEVPKPNDGTKNNGSGSQKPTEMPGHDNQGTGGDNSGNGKHGP